MNKKNLANAQLLDDVTETQTTIEIKQGQGADMPPVPFHATLTPLGMLSTIDNSEIVLVTDVSLSDVLTVERGQRGTTPKFFTRDSVIANGVYAEDFEDIRVTMLNSVYPVGTEYTNYVNGTNPSTLLDMPWATWEKVEDTFTLGSGAKVAGSTGGAETVSLTAAQNGTHSHSNGTLSAVSGGAHTHSNGTLSAASAGAHTHTPNNIRPSGAEANGYGLIHGGGGGFANRVFVNGPYASSSGMGINSAGAHTHNVTGATSSGGAHTHNVTGSTSDSGSGQAHENMPPYRVAYKWERIS